RRPQKNLFAQPRQIRCGDRRRSEKLQRKIACGHGIHGIAHWTVKSERFRGCLTVNRIRCACECGGAEWRFIQALRGIGKTPTVTCCHLDISYTMMAESHWLRELH